MYTGKYVQMRYSNVKEIKTPAQHQIKDTASAWVWGQHHSLFPRCRSVLLKSEYSKGLSRLFGWHQLQEVTQVFWSGGGLFGVLLAWIQGKPSIRWRWDAIKCPPAMKSKIWRRIPRTIRQGCSSQHLCRGTALVSSAQALLVAMEQDNSEWPGAIQ